jgi:hypothetical protein
LFLTGVAPAESPLCPPPGKTNGNNSRPPPRPAPPPFEHKKNHDNNTNHNHQKPNSLSSLILLRAPAAFSALWMLVKPFIDPVTANKVRFVGSLPAMRRLAAAMMVGASCAEQAEQAARLREEHRRSAERERRQREQRERKQHQQQGGNDGENGGGGGGNGGGGENADWSLSPDLAAAEKEVAAALASLPAAVVGAGCGMPDDQVPPIEQVTARLLAAGRLPRSRVEQEEEEERKARAAAAAKAAAAKAAAAAAAAKEAAMAAEAATAAADDAPASPTTVSALKSRLMASRLVQRLKLGMVRHGE